MAADRGKAHPHGNGTPARRETRTTSPSSARCVRRVRARAKLYVVARLKSSRRSTRTAAVRHSSSQNTRAGPSSDRLAAREEPLPVRQRPYRPLRSRREAAVMPSDSIRAAGSVPSFARSACVVCLAFLRSVAAAPAAQVRHPSSRERPQRRRTCRPHTRSPRSVTSPAQLASRIRRGCRGKASTFPHL